MAFKWPSRTVIRGTGIAVFLMGTFLPGPAGLAPTHAADSAWTADAISWQFTEGTIRTARSESGMAVLSDAPLARCVTVEADVQVTEVADQDWKVAGIVIRQDERNFWHFALIEAPSDKKRYHAVELAEMRDGRWLAHHNLRRTVDETNGGPWKIGERYRLRIAMDPQGVEGELFSANGRRLRRIRYAFSDTAVTSGRPALRSNHCTSEFTAIRTHHANPTATSPREFPPYESESHVPEICGRATGFFHVKQDGDAWWVIDPLGRGFVPLGVDHVRYEGHWCEALGYQPYKRKNDNRYGGRQEWADETLGRLKDWGFNLLGGGASPELFRRGLAHTRFIGIGSNLARRGGDCDITPHEGRPCSAFPNVFHPNFERYCRGQAYRLCVTSRGDPWLFGYFLDNELAWWGRGGLETGLFDAVMNKPAQHSAKQALVRFLRERYRNDVAELNRKWGTRIESFEGVLSRSTLSGKHDDAVTEAKQAFLALAAERYFGTLAQAIRAVDPDHMILGSRFAGGHCSEVVWKAAAQHCDVLTFNYYGNVDLNRRIALDHSHDAAGRPLGEVFAEFYEMGGRPMMVTEWSFPALDSGLPCTKGAGQRFRRQAERAEASDIFARTLLRMPYILGYCYFMWVDEPALGITPAFPENSNYGLIDEDGQPYAKLTTALRRVHGEAGRLRGMPPVEPPPAVEVTPSCRSGKEIALAIGRTDGEGSLSEAPPPSLQWHRGGDVYRLETGTFTLSGTVGGSRLIESVEHRGVVLGWYNAMVQQWNREDWWVENNQLVDVQADVGPRCATLDLTGRYDVEGDWVQPFEICHRLTFLPESDWFTAELLWCRNLGREPLEARAFFFRPHGEVGGSAEHDAALRDGSVPRLWGRPVGDGWIDQSAGAFWGFAAARRERITISFRLNEHGGQHPDARWEKHVTIGPGEKFVPERPVWILAVAGRGDRRAFEDGARRLVTKADPTTASTETTASPSNHVEE